MKWTDDTRAWVKALASGNYKQAQSYMRETLTPDDGGEPTVGYCCLGVAGELCGLAFVEVEGSQQDAKREGFMVGGDPSAGQLPEAIRERYGMTLEDQRLLIKLNDSENWDFGAIAYIIRKAARRGDGGVAGALADVATMGWLKPSDNVTITPAEGNALP